MKQNYLPLFRKYRPQSFSDVVGQENLVKALTNAIELGRIAQAYLFCGPRGTGKTSSARILAKSLNCINGPTLEPCQKCASCVDITNATGLDVIEIDAASNRGIQDAKELIAQAQYAPINGKYKIFIIDEVHMLSTDAFNALLKTFEEPPKNVIFILATTEPHKVLETIVSRCQRFDLRRITTEDIVKRLREISDLEGIKITDDALFTIAKNVSGGLRDSLALLDQVSILGVKEEIGVDLIEELLGKINFDTLLKLLKFINIGDIERTLVCVDEIYTKGSEPRNLAENFIEFLRNVVLVLNSKNTDNISNFTTLIKENIEKIQAANFDKDKIARILNVIIEYYKEIKVSTNPYLWMELAALAAARVDMEPTKAQTVVVEKVQAPKVETIKPVEPIKVQPTTPMSTPTETVAPTIPPTQAPSQAPTAAPVNNSSMVDGAQLWADVVSKIPSLPSRAFYSGVAKLVSTKDNKITLGFLHENALTQAKSDTKLSQLKTAIAAVAPNYSTEFIKIDANTQVIEVKPKIAPAPAPRPQVPSHSQPQPSAKQEEPAVEDEAEEKKKETVKKHYSPKVQEMLEQYNGKIIED